MTGAQRSALGWLWVSALVVVLDRLTKVAASAVLELHRPVAVFPGLNLTLTYNTGAAFSLLSDAGGWQRWFFVVLALAASAVILFWLRMLPARNRWLGGALALVLGGALGNLWDRLAHGYVIDFIDAYYRDWHWPAFNLADAAISVGAILLVLDGFRPARRTA